MELDCKLVEVDLPEGKAWSFDCPWCRLLNVESKVVVLQAEVACRRMIHGVVKATGLALPPHSSRAACEGAGELWGCGRSLEILPDGAVMARAWES